MNDVNNCMNYMILITIFHLDMQKYEYQRFQDTDFR